MNKKNNLFKKFKRFFKKYSDDNICPYCSSKELLLQKTTVSKSKTLREKNYILKCITCQRIGIRKEIWHDYEMTKNILTDNEIQIEN